MRTLPRLCMLLIPFACHAQAAVSDADFCRNGLFPREQEHLSLGVVQGRPGEKVHFLDDMDGCPSKGAMCMRPAYLVPGNEILVGKRTADWACVWYQGRKHEFVSWVPRKNVVLLPAPPLHPVRDWVGLWSDGLSTIRLSPSKEGGKLRISSSLRWDGGVDPAGERRMNVGGMTGTIDLHGVKATGAEGDCQVTLARIGQYLLADDNGDCGGMNVRHTGMYFRR
jgi:hypothetical protein